MIQCDLCICEHLVFHVVNNDEEIDLMGWSYSVDENNYYSLSEPTPMLDRKLPVASAIKSIATSSKYSAIQLLISLYLLKDHVMGCKYLG